MLEAGDHRIISQDAMGRVHFNPAFENADFLSGALAAIISKIIQTTNG